MRILPIAAALRDQPLSKVTHGQIIVDKVNAGVTADNHIALNWTGTMLSVWIKALDPTVRRALFGIVILNSGQSITFNAEALATATFVTVDSDPFTGDGNQTTRIGNVVTIAMTSFIILAVFGVLLYYIFVNGSTPDTPPGPPPPTPRSNVDH